MTPHEPFDPAYEFGRILFGRALFADESAAISAIVRLRHCTVNEVILAEGGMNELLFFLLEGSVSIIRNREMIAKIDTSGTVLGEMSVISRKPCSASNLALKPTTLLVLELRKVPTLPPAIATRITSALNLLFAVSLAEKLDNTNEKARLFEITNRELQFAKQALETASSDKIDELAGSQRAILRTLKAVFDEDILPLHASLIQAELNLTAAFRSGINRIFRRIEPLVKNYGAETGLREKRVLMVEDNVDEQINAKMSLGGTGVDFTVVSDLDLAKAAITAKSFDVICVNASFVELISFARENHAETQFVFLTSDPIEIYFQTVQKFPELSTVLSRHPEDRTFTVRNIASTIRKLVGQDIFGMEKYLSWGTEVFEMPVTSSEDRPSLIAKLEEYLDSIAVRGGLKRKATRVLEELLMNAIYDAPTGADGKSLYNHIDRGTPLVLKPNEYATFRYACDGTFLAISVVDPFGAITRETIIKYLARCFAEKIGGGDIAGKGGGGNGLFQIIQSSSLTAFNVQAKVKTEVIALLNINIQMEKVSTHPSFHFFEAEPRGSPHFTKRLN
jgi:CRP-like cAMP-binding protein